MIEMLGKNITLDVVIYDIFIYGFCKYGKMSSAFKVLRDMEKKGCQPSTKAYILLIWGLGMRNKIDGMHNLIDEMHKKGVNPDSTTYNNLIHALCEGGMVLADAAQQYVVLSSFLSQTEEYLLKLNDMLSHNFHHRYETIFYINVFY